MKKLLVLVVILFSVNVLADEYAHLDRPVMEGVRDQGSISKSMRRFSPDYAELMKKLVIKIFPHNDNRAPHREDQNKHYLKFKSTVYMTLKRGNQTVCRAKVLEFNRVEVKNDRVYCGNSRRGIALTTNDDQRYDYIITTNNKEPVQVIRAGHDNNYFYWGKLSIKMKPDRLVLMNTVDMETYLRGVVPGEIFVSWPKETVKSQAVAARSYALYHLERLYDNYILYHFDDTTSYQVYIGDYTYYRRHRFFGFNELSLEQLESILDSLKSLPAFLEALKETEGEVMLHNDRIFQAYFHAASGGYTVRADDLDFRDCAPCAEVFDYSEETVRNDSFSRRYLEPLEFWTRERSKKDVEERLKKRSLIKKYRSLNKILLPEDGYDRPYRSQYGHYVKVPLRVSGKLKVVPGYPFKSAMGLKNVRYNIRLKNNTYIFTGRGYGHSIGLCQWGAYFRGKDNIHYHDILNHYYHGMEIRRF